LRFAFIASLLMVLMVLLAGLQGCATQDPAARAAQQAALESDDDELCRKQGPSGSEAYDKCREQREAARVRAAAVQEQKRRDFDRLLGAGTDAQTNF
jgi:hypothetical protein